MGRPRGRRRKPTRLRRPPATWLALGVVAVLMGAATVGVVSLATDGGGGGAAEEQPPPQQVQPIPDGATPAEDARNLSAWLRENAGG